MSICRRALTIVEVALAFAILALVMAASLRMIHVVTDQQRAGHRRDFALQAAQAISEQIGNIPWNQLTPEALNQIEIPTFLAERLPNAQVSAELADETNPTAKRVTVAIRWRAGDAPPTTVRLTSWVFPDSLGQE
jgi:hypothetical protein